MKRLFKILWRSKYGDVRTFVTNQSSMYDAIVCLNNKYSKQIAALEDYEAHQVAQQYPSLYHLTQ